RMATCSPASIESVIPSSAILSPLYTVTLWNSMRGGVILFDSRARFQIETIPGGEKVKRLPCLVDRDLAPADHFKTVALHDDGGPFIEADAEQRRMRSDDPEQILLSLSGQ